MCAIFQSSRARAVVRRYGRPVRRQEDADLDTDVSAAIAGLLAALQFAGLMNEAWLVAGAIVIDWLSPSPCQLGTSRCGAWLDRTRLRPAYAMDSVSYNLGRALAPPLSILLISEFGFGYAFIVNSISFLLFAAVLQVAGRARANRKGARGSGMVS